MRIHFECSYLNFFLKKDLSRDYNAASMSIKQVIYIKIGFTDPEVDRVYLPRVATLLITTLTQWTVAQDNREMVNHNYSTHCTLN